MRMKQTNSSQGQRSPMVGALQVCDQCEDETGVLPSRSVDQLDYN